MLPKLSPCYQWSFAENVEFGFGKELSVATHTLCAKGNSIFLIELEALSPISSVDGLQTHSLSLALDSTICLRKHFNSFELIHLVSGMEEEVQLTLHDAETDFSLALPLVCISDANS